MNEQLGIVSLVGAGPGDVELLTLKGKRLLEGADAVFYDELANPALLELAPTSAERVYVGKRAYHHAIPQSEISAWMIDRARRGWRVVRLKGGDPFVFGRGGEEAEALARAGIPWEAVPGVSSGTGAATAAGIPLTQRGIASSVRFVTGHSAFERNEAGFGAPGGETLVVFMGLERLEAIAEELISNQWPADTPAALIENGTLPHERIVTGSLSTLAQLARDASIRPPALLIVGDVVAWSDRIRDRGDSGSPTSPARARAVSLPGLILMAHGSPLPGWQVGVERLARDLAAPRQFTRAAYLPPVQPGLSQAVDDAVRAGVERLAVVPYFLAAGVHVTRDLPAMVESERQRYPGLRIELASCLEGHPALRTAVLSRAGEALAALRGDRVDSSSSSAARVRPAIALREAQPVAAPRG